MNEHYELEYVVCPDCNGTGSGEFWGARYFCQTCKGRGEIPAIVDVGTGEIVEELIEGGIAYEYGKEID